MSLEDNQSNGVSLPVSTAAEKSQPKKFKKYLVVICILLSFFTINRATRWYVRNAAASQCGNGVYFDEYEKDLNEFVSRHELQDGEKLLDESIPYELRRHRIWIIYRKGRYVFFQLRPHWIDDALQEFVWPLHNEGGSVNELCRSAGTVYQIYMLRNSKWLFWMHN